MEKNNSFNNDYKTFFNLIDELSSKIHEKEYKLDILDFPPMVVSPDEVKEWNKKLRKYLKQIDEGTFLSNIYKECE